MKKLSVIVPVYNVEKYIVTCIESVLQNNLSQKDYEIILVDDASPDNSVLLIEPYLSKNCKLIRQENKGLGGARNTGIQNSTGSFLLFLDSDDVVLPNTLEKIIQLAEENNLDILEFAAKGIKNNNEQVYKVENSTNGVVLDGVTYYNSIRYMNSSCNKLYAKEFLMRNELFFTERIFIEDFEFNTRAFVKAQRVMASNFLVSGFLQTSNSITRNTNHTQKRKMINDILLVLNKTIKEQKEHLKTKQNEIFFEERKSFLVATLFYQLIKNKATSKEFFQLKKELQSKNLFFVNNSIHDRRKDLFRRIILKNSWMYYCLKPFFSLKG